LEVYLDAVFNPILNELSFMQEGIRLEFAVPWDPSTNLEFKGVVYNEMKGVLSAPFSRLNEEINKLLFPDITYGYNSGGDPKVIPQLTYDELLDFHKKYYHPSRCLFFFYGNMPLENHLDFIANATLKHAQKVPELPTFPLQPRFTQPKCEQTSYPIAQDEDEKDKTLIGFGWLTCHILNQEEVLALNVLELILLDTDASPLKMALLKSGWCTQVISYMETDVNEIPWIIVLRGTNSDKADLLEELLRNTLKTIVEDGIPMQLIENAMHQLEIHRSEIGGNHSPFGLSLFMRSGLLKQHGGRPEDGLVIHSLFDQLHKMIQENPRFFSELIQRYLLDNPHFVRVVMVPDKNLSEEEREFEKKTLEKMRENSTELQIQEIVHKASELTSFQKKQEEESTDILPKVTLADVPLATRNFLIKQESVGNLEVFSHECFTNEIVYADLIYDLPELSEEDLPYVRLFSVILPQIGCGGRDYKANLEYIQGNTGGVGVNFSLNLQVSDYQKLYPSLHLQGKALYRKAEKLFHLFNEIETSANFDDEERIKEILLKHYTALHSSLTQSSLKYAMNLSSSSLNIACKLANDWYGLPYYWKIREIIEHLDSNPAKVIVKMKQLQERLLALRNPHLVITCDQVMYDEMKSKGFYGLQDIPMKVSIPWKGVYPLTQVIPQGRVIASPVACVAKVFKTIHYSHPNSPALYIAAFLFDNLTLHRRIREQGGAYGGGSASNTMAGNFYFYSYRDPNISSTLLAFQEAVNNVMEGNFDTSDLEEAKLEMIQVLDNPIAPGSRGLLAYTYLREGKTLEVRQTFRNKILSLTKEDVIAAVQQEIYPQLNTGSTVVFSGRDLLERENQILSSQGIDPLRIESI
jgi:Zn-dependent M16 (insulinase) family peptidase